MVLPAEKVKKEDGRAQAERDSHQTVGDALGTRPPVVRDDPAPMVGRERFHQGSWVAQRDHAAGLSIPPAKGSAARCATSVTASHVA